MTVGGKVTAPRDDTVSLAGQVAVITGAGRGMGREIALTFARLGAVVAVLERDDGSAQATVDELRAGGGVGEAFQCDVALPASVEHAVGAVLGRLGRIDVLVNNAGIATYTRPMEAIGDEEWTKVLAVNLSGAFYVMRAVLPVMKAQRRGRIVNISSSAGRSVSTFAGANYTASKAALLGLTRHVALEAAPYGVTVNAIAPGTIDTPLLREAASEERIRQEASKIPLGRLGTVVDIAGLVAFLASPSASYITGATVDINGGDLIL